MPMPFPRLRGISPDEYTDTESDPGTEEYSEGKNVEKLFYDTLCTCIDEWDTYSEIREDKNKPQCVRDEDCCDGMWCWENNNPVTDGTIAAPVKMCEDGCLEDGKSCDPDADHCCEYLEAGCFQDPDPGAGGGHPYCSDCRTSDSPEALESCNTDEDCCGHDSEGAARNVCLDPNQFVVPGVEAPGGGDNIHYDNKVCHNCAGNRNRCTQDSDCCSSVHICTDDHPLDDTPDNLCKPICLHECNSLIADPICSRVPGYICKDLDGDGNGRCDLEGGACDPIP